MSYSQFRSKLVEVMRDIVNQQPEFRGDLETLAKLFKSPKDIDVIISGLGWLSEAYDYEDFLPRDSSDSDSSDSDLSDSDLSDSDLMESAAHKLKRSLTKELRYEVYALHMRTKSALAGPGCSMKEFDKWRYKGDLGYAIEEAFLK